MRRLVTLILVLAVVPTLAWGQQIHPLVGDMGYADLILTNGKIVTMDDRSITPNTPGNIVESMAVKGKRIMAVGSNSEMRELAGPKTRFVDVGNKTVIPGLIQTHYHLFSSAARTYGPQYGLTDPSIKLNVIADETVEGTAKKVRDVVLNAIQVQNIPSGDWISVSVGEAPENLPGTNRTWFYIGSLNRRQLDAATPNHPVIVTGTIGGYFNAKARKLKAFAAHVAINYQGDLDRFLATPTASLREELLSIHGIGEETADDIMVYAADKPSFVIDTYTRRIMDRMEMTPDAARPKYGDYQVVFHHNLPLETTLYNEFHALWDRHAKEACAKTPRCKNCCLLDLCPTGQKLTSVS